MFGFLIAVGIALREKLALSPQEPTSQPATHARVRHEMRDITRQYSRGAPISVDESKALWQLQSKKSELEI